MKKLNSEFDELEIGDEVTVEEGGQDLHGVIESFQINARLIDVKIYEPGHRKHCLIQAFSPDQVFRRQPEVPKKEKAQSA
jgi:hypothetical protein